MSGRIFHLSDDDQLVSMDEQPYESEALLQSLLASYPSLLAGDQMNTKAPREWLLVQRERGIPDEEGGSSRWSVDHLFLDQDGVPTLVEVKRSTDTRIRREVVGQMLDYAANAVVNLPIERIRADFEAETASAGGDPAERVRQLLEDSDDVEQFWGRVKVNLQAGRVRLVFVADRIPSELKRVVEFLNEQMDPAEVLAVEVRQFVGEGRRTLVPRVIGQTAQAEQRKHAGRPSRQWDESSLLSSLDEHRGSAARDVAERLIRWSGECGEGGSYGTGPKMGSFTPKFTVGGRNCPTFCIWTGWDLNVQFDLLSRTPPFDREELRREFQAQLNRIQGVEIPDHKLDGRPTISYEVLVTDHSFRLFTDAITWVVQTARDAADRSAET